ncbi:hypothetical protein KIH07_16935 [Hydrogenophaga taeniospiralis]|uniref:hypothetical protein n=1 Tax=Hydrogenophaga taeniospiralis TaxID=65656 RepID=UPI001CFC1C72|nr:hypothetical protein [Hydrogenophaga taeniospiralis]MCB4365431.1 hypothetical protein [Hydrogenophaga taeniospiralis]
MPQVHMTFTDTPSGGVAVHSDFQPAVGKPCSPAQAAALEIYNRTRKQWGVEDVHAHAETANTAQPVAGA